MKKVTSTLTALFLCLYVSAQVGTLDESFNPLPGTPGYVVNNALSAGADSGKAIGTHSDGRVVVAAYTADMNFTLLRYTLGGTLDNSFGTNGVVDVRQTPGREAVPFAITVLPDNSMLVAGWSVGATGGVTGREFALVKLLENGTPDVNFGTGGWVVTPIGSGQDEARAIAVQNDGKIVVAGFTFNGTDKDFAVVRYNADGSLDNTGFGTGIVTTHINGHDEASAVVIQQDGKIVVGGTSNKGTNTNGNFTAVRYTANGTIDNLTYGSGGIAIVDIANGGAGSNDESNAMALQPDGKVIMTGTSKAVAATNNDVATIRLTTDGIPDTDFNGDGNNDGIIVFDYAADALNSDEDANSIALQSDGKFIIGGDIQPISENFRFMLLRYNANGSLDGGFDSDGIVTADITADQEFGHAVKLYANRIYLLGSTGSPSDLLLAAFENDGTPLPLVLSNFYAQKLNNTVLLQWQTASEENVKQFVIERSNDGKTYKAIGQVAATGNSTITQNYSYTDQSPFTATSNYYRLLMQDIDGNYTYSKTLIIKFDSEISANLQTFPNPVKDLLQVQVPNGMKGIIGLQIIDMNGRVVKSNNLASDGNALNTTIDVSSLGKGVYILKAQAGSTTAISRFVKQ